MAISFGAGFKMSHTEPVDNRLVLSKQEMVNMKRPQMPDVYLCVCADDKELYIYNKENEDIPETGRFRKALISSDTIDIEALTENEIIALCPLSNNQQEE